MAIPDFLLQKLQALDSGSTFAGRLPRITSSSGTVYFVKSGSTREVEQYEGEAQSLIAMGRNAEGLVPRVLDYGVSESGHPYFISEYKDFSGLSNDSGSILGKRLATELHTSQGSKGFGFAVPTFCGATKQRNGWFETWEECFSQMIGDLLKTLEERGNYTKVCAKGRQLSDEVIPKLLRPLKIEPVLCHGDLWSGNTGTLPNGQPIIFDPSSYYGHNESDFFIEYHKHFPKSEPVNHYELRAELYELYHYLNHTVLFGSGYAGSALQKMELLLKAEL
ncbi:fructosamine kinase PKL/CAK/FruK [Flagelloscypha sp. PMI_526]|nr:fructosamine kinase PKL/CAK/FruK [Flagelloscypha sp. PMI_526]